jgi:hypothetical protein
MTHFDIHTDRNNVLHYFDEPNSARLAYFPVSSSYFHASRPAILTSTHFSEAHSSFLLFLLFRSMMMMILVESLLEIFPLQALWRPPTDNSQLACHFSAMIAPIAVLQFCAGKKGKYRGQEKRNGGDDERVQSDFLCNIISSRMEETSV